MEVTATVLIQGQGDTFTDADHVTDGAANRFVAYGEQLGNETWATIRRIAPNGTVTGMWTVFPTDNHKIDEVTLAHSGDVLLVLLTTHEIVSVKPRSIRIESAAIPGVYAVRAGQEAEEGASGAFQPEGEPGGGVEVDYEQIKQIVKVEVDAAKKLIIDNMISKTTAAIEQKRVVTEEMFSTKPPWEGGKSSPIIYEQLKNTSHSGTMTALAAYGACKDTDSLQKMADDILTEQEHSLELPESEQMP